MFRKRKMPSKLGMLFSEETWFITITATCYSIALMIFLFSVADGVRKPKPWVIPDPPISVRR